jgi:Asp-tRNA(Asn)/Glu-tRNA(Gln) amidotransferase A subunit family amidase
MYAFFVSFNLLTKKHSAMCKTVRTFPFTKVLSVLIPAAVLILSCDRNKKEPAEPYVNVEIDSTYYAMNPMDLEFDSLEMIMIDSGMADYIDAYREIRAYELPNSTPPAIRFDPIPKGFRVPEPTGLNRWDIPEGISRPAREADLAFMSIPELASLIHSGEISCLALTEFFLNRLKTYDPQLHCVVTLTEQYAVEQARKLDAELAEGHDRGILHGIPYGAKDLFSFPGYPTTWGAGAYKDQVRDEKAGVIRKLEDAGAVLVAKTTLGALAMGDVWFADTTRNPWNLEEGSSGSSAGSASATAAGLLPFAIGTETWGSIVSPSTRCGTTGLRPTFGRVTRSGAMALSWSMDKVGPICRSASDCAIVFDFIRGPDPDDGSVIEAGYTYPGEVDLSKLKIGYLKGAFEGDYDVKDFDRKTLRVLGRLGAELVPVELVPEGIPVDALSLILEAEAAAAFDELTRSNRDTLLVRQHRYAWPNIFRTARFIPAVEYIQANRIRYDLVQELNRRIRDFDVVVAPSFYGSSQLLATNLTGNPVVVVPNGFKDNGSPTSISFLGNLFDEGTVLAVAAAYQEATGFNAKRPPLFSGEE